MTWRPYRVYSAANQYSVLHASLALKGKLNRWSCRGKPVFDLDDFYSVQVVKQIRITTSASANPRGIGAGCTSNSAAWFFLRWKLRWICSFLAWAGKAGACVHHVQGLAQSFIRKRKQVTSVRQGLSYLAECSGQDLKGGHGFVNYPGKTIG